LTRAKAYLKIDVVSTGKVWPRVMRTYVAKGEEAGGAQSGRGIGLWWTRRTRCWAPGDPGRADADWQRQPSFTPYLDSGDHVVVINGTRFA